MHFHFNFTAVEVLWALTFAALLVLLVVLLGRDRAKSFPWFTASIVLMGLRLLTQKLLYDRLSPIPYNAILISLIDLGVLVGLMVLVELARKAFGAVSRRNRLVGTLILLAAGALVLRFWGMWPEWKTLTADSSLTVLRVMQLGAQKGTLLVDLLTVGVGLLVVALGRRYGAGWRSHTQQLIIGLSTASIAQLTVQGILQAVFAHAAPKTQGDVNRILGLRDKIYDANNVVYLVVIAWWIACLWIDEPGAGATEAAVEIPAGEAEGEPVELMPEEHGGGI